MRKVLVLLLLYGVFMITGCTAQEANISDELTEDTLQEEAAAELTEVAVESNTGRMGSYELEECRDPGIYVLMPDGSFESYGTGKVLHWSNELMTYGVESFPRGLLMNKYQYDINNENLKKGELVLFCSKDHFVMNGMFAVTESGSALSYYDEDESKTTVMLMNNSIDYQDYLSFRTWEFGSGSIQEVETKIETIDGILLEDTKDIYSVEARRHYVDLPEDMVLKMGVSEGTTLYEKEFEADYKYFLQEADLNWSSVSEGKYELKLRPTTDGYAVIDFSEIPTGDYIINVTWWEEETNGRRALSTFITVE